MHYPFSESLRIYFVFLSRLRDSLVKRLILLYDLKLVLDMRVLTYIFSTGRSKLFLSFHRFH